MIRKTSEMPSLLLRIITDVETEVVEYKEQSKTMILRTLESISPRLAMRQICAKQNADGFSSAFQTTVR